MPDKVTLTPIRGHKNRKNTVRLTFSRNIVDGLLEYYDRVWHEGPFWRKHEYRYDYDLRFQIAPFHRLRMAGCLVRIHPHLLGPEAGRGTKVYHTGNRFYVQMVGHKLGFRNNVKTKQIDFAWAPYGFGGHGGIVLWFDDEDMKFPSWKQVDRLPKDTDFIIR